MPGFELGQLRVLLGQLRVLLGQLLVLLGQLLVPILLQGFYLRLNQLQLKLMLDHQSPFGLKLDLMCPSGLLLFSLRGVLVGHRC